MPRIPSDADAAVNETAVNQAAIAEAEQAQSNATNAQAANAHAANDDGTVPPGTTPPAVANPTNFGALGASDVNRPIIMQVAEIKAAEPTPGLSDTKEGGEFIVNGKRVDAHGQPLEK